MAENNYLFIHIPKTGGRSVLDALKVKFHCEHKSLQEYITELGKPVVSERYKFTIIRNPWDRAVSWYRFFYHPMPNEEPLSFDDWILTRNGKIIRPDRPSFNRVKSPLDVLSYCRTLSGEILIDKFLKFENLNEDFKEIAQRLNISSKLPHIGKGEQETAIQQTSHLLKINKTNKKIDIETSLNYRDLYKTQEAKDFVGSLNKELIERFGYKF